MKLYYKPTKFKEPSQLIILHARTIIEEYKQAGFSLTLRQLYYQFVARDLIENSDKSYKRMGKIISNARMAGSIDWNAIVDRTRFIRERSKWQRPKELLVAAAKTFHHDFWSGQDNYVEVWIEKDALVGVIENVCFENDVTYFSCRGYVSSSAMFEASQRMVKQFNMGKNPIILHLGDHDPSGIQMTDDIASRINLLAQGGTEIHHTPDAPDPDDEFTIERPPNDYCHPQCNIKVKRIALTMEQIDDQNPPPNHAKLSDSRASDYIAAYGYSSWELDALSPDFISNLINRELNLLLSSKDLFQERKEAQTKLRLDAIDKLREAYGE